MKIEFEIQHIFKKVGNKAPHLLAKLLTKKAEFQLSPTLSLNGKTVKHFSILRSINTKGEPIFDKYQFQFKNKSDRESFEVGQKAELKEWFFYHLDKKILVLDLDEFLIHAIKNILSASADFFSDGFCVYKRPGIDDFFRNWNERFSIPIWSSAIEGWVNSIMDQAIGGSIKLSFNRLMEIVVPRSDSYRIGLPTLRRQPFDL